MDLFLGAGQVVKPPESGPGFKLDFYTGFTEIA